jgi:hypothetical protein
LLSPALEVAAKTRFGLGSCIKANWFKTDLLCSWLCMNEGRLARPEQTFRPEIREGISSFVEEWLVNRGRHATQHPPDARVGGGAHQTGRTLPRSRSTVCARLHRVTAGVTSSPRSPFHARVRFQNSSFSFHRHCRETNLAIMSWIFPHGRPAESAAERLEPRHSEPGQRS